MEGLHHLTGEGVLAPIFSPTSEVGTTVTGAGFFLSRASAFHWNVYIYLLLWSWAVGRAGSRGACLWI